MARRFESSNPVFTRSEPLVRASGVGFRTTSVDDAAQIYATPQRLTMEDILLKTAILLGIIFVTSDLEEVLSLSDRIIVMSEGRISGEFSGKQATGAGLIAASTARPASQRLETAR